MDPERYGVIEFNAERRAISIDKARTRSEPAKSRSR
jgi:dTDP-glucose pyrophosphorylase